MGKYVVILDNGHGKNTPGKKSPKITGDMTIGPMGKHIVSDGRFCEWMFSRKVVETAKPMLEKLGIDVEVIVNEEKDISLNDRVKRTNAVAKKHGTGNCVFVSVHANAAGSSDKWMSARGWSIWTTKGQNNSDKLAESIYSKAVYYINDDPVIRDSFKNEKVQKAIRTDMSDGDHDYEAGFAVIKGAACPAVLIENFFQDNKKDVEYLTSENGFHRVVATMVYGINDYFKKYKGKKD